MNLHHLLIFKTVAETRSMTQAAERLLISQPAISVQLKQLEKSLESKLFQRRPRGIELTASGELLADYARRIFVLADDAAVAIRDLQGLKRGRLRLAASPTIGVYFLPRLLVHFQRRFPQIQLHVEIEETDLIQQRLGDGHLDLGLSPAAATLPHVHATPFMQEEFVAVAAARFPLAKKRRVTIEQLAESFISRQIPSATGGMVLGYFARHNIPVRPILSLGSLEAVKQAVLAGLGVTIISKMAVAPDIASRKLALLKVDSLPLCRPLYELHQREKSKAAVAFSCLLKHAARGTLPRLTSQAV